MTDRLDFIDDVAKRLFVECQDGRASYDLAEALWLERVRRGRVEKARYQLTVWEGHEHRVEQDKGGPWCAESECLLAKCESNMESRLAWARYVLDHDGEEPPKDAP